MTRYQLAEAERRRRRTDRAWDLFGGFCLGTIATSIAGILVLTIR